MLKYRICEFKEDKLVKVSRYRDGMWRYIFPDFNSFEDAQQAIDDLDIYFSGCEFIILPVYTKE